MMRRDGDGTGGDGGFRSRGGRDVQEVLMFLPASGSADRLSPRGGGDSHCSRRDEKPVRPKFPHGLQELCTKHSL